MGLGEMIGYAMLGGCLLVVILILLDGGPS